MSAFDSIRMRRHDPNLRPADFRRVALLVGGAFLQLIVFSAVIMLAQRTTALGSQAARLPDFAAIGATDARKEAFFDFLVPMVHTSNERVLRERYRLERILARIERGVSPGWGDRRWIARVAEAYDAPLGETIDSESLRELLVRVDVIPADLALAQGALESGWGTSRFAREGNNLFGMWCYQPGCGIVPQRRPEGATHEVARYSSPEGSIRAYVRNLNTNSAYQPLREIRSALREEGHEITGEALADGILRYSEEGPEYVRKVRDMIRSNDLQRFNRFGANAGT